MPYVTLRLDHVFDVVHGTGRNNRTFFSFESGETSQYGVQLPGSRTFQDGMVVTAFLQEEGNWQTLLAWGEHATGEVVSLRSEEALFGGLAVCMGGAAAAGLWDGHVVLSSLVAMLAGAGLVALVKQMRVRADIATTLRESCRP
ncbi:MAG: hypothetical protein ACJ8GW_18920 [Massilia sp.]